MLGLVVIHVHLSKGVGGFLKILSFAYQESRKEGRTKKKGARRFRVSKADKYDNEYQVGLFRPAQDCSVTAVTG